MAPSPSGVLKAHGQRRGLLILLILERSPGLRRGRRRLVLGLPSQAVIIFLFQFFVLIVHIFCLLVRQSVALGVAINILDFWPGMLC